ncbi:MAG TPA: hypothetical protein VGB24_12385 [Longimicrobium sp.]|uniref:hypothetical protein n=1 Tax=Longimicrobium sp. TaxID=2029185 RepID=UPI002ED77193
MSMMALLLGPAQPAQLPALDYQLAVVDDSTTEVRVSFEPRGHESAEPAPGRISRVRLP